jgi:hypothetical protein
MEMANRSPNEPATANPAIASGLQADRTPTHANHEANAENHRLVHAGLGCVLVYATLATYLHARRFLRSAVQTQGFVTALVPMDPEDARAVFGDASTNIPGPMYSYAYSFRDSQGAERGAVSSSGSWPSEFKVGDAVTVLYLPGHPESPELQKNSDPWTRMEFTGLVGASVYVSGFL